MLQRQVYLPSWRSIENVRSMTIALNPGVEFIVAAF